MSETIKTLLIVYLFVNIVVMLIYGIDKYKATHDRWRIPEKTLILAAVVGAPGALLGMYIFHHKTRKLKFSLGVPAILIAEIVIFVIILLKMKHVF